MYLGEPSVSKLHMFLLGYLCGREDLRPLSKEEDWNIEFGLWVAEKFNVNISQD